MQVLTALAEAQKLGFRHWDLRMTNIMEHHPPSEPVAAPTAPKIAGSQVRVQVYCGSCPHCSHPVSLVLLFVGFQCLQSTCFKPG